MNNLVSTIIPVYNNEKYVTECLQSIISNDEYNKINEIIIINDRSTDNTEDIVLDFITTHNDINIRYFKNETNLGTTITRNKGLELATGKYIHFADSDDLVNPDVFLKMMKHLEKYGEDYCICKNLDLDSNGKPHDKFFYNNVKFLNLCNEIINGQIMDYQSLLVSATLWILLIRKDFLTNNNLSFRRDKLGEDIDFVHRVYYYASRFGYIPEVGYYYRANNGIWSSNGLKSWEILINKVNIPLLEDEEFSQEFKNIIAQNMFLTIPCTFLELEVTFEYLEETYDKISKYMNDDVKEILPKHIIKFYENIENGGVEKFNLYKKLYNIYNEK